MGVNCNVSNPREISLAQLCTRSLLLCILIYCFARALKYTLRETNQEFKGDWGLSSLPEVSFKVYHRDEVYGWLIKKKDYIKERWNRNRDGIKLMKKIKKTCRLDFPVKILNTGLSVVIRNYSRKKHGGLLGSVSPRSPRLITLFVKKKDKYTNLKSTLCHELIHSLMWSNTLYDQRRTAVSLFADIFADELLTTLLEQLILKGEFSKVDFEWALDYARKETSTRLRNLKREKDYKKIIDELEIYLKDYKRAIRQGSNALKERQRALRDIWSPLVLDE